MLNQKERREAIDYLVRIRNPGLWLELLKPELDETKGRAAAEAATADRLALEALLNRDLEKLYVETKAEQDRKVAVAREGRHYFNSDQAKSVNLSYWVAMDWWSFDEAISLICGRDPTIVKWDGIKGYTLVSPFAGAYERVRLLAMRSGDMNFGRSGVWRNNTCAWLLSNMPAIPREVADSAKALCDVVAAWVRPVAELAAQNGGPLPTAVDAGASSAGGQAQEAAPAAQPAEATTQVYRTADGRSNILTAVIESAITLAGDDESSKAWAELERLARGTDRPAPLAGVNSGGVQYHDGGQIKTLTYSAFRNRLRRRRENAR